ncbi:MAG: IS1595 family transposase [Elusimicrobiota bacterium]
MGQKVLRSGKPSPRRVWRCKGCRKDFTVLVGTIFEGTHIPVSKWLLGLFLMNTGKNGVSAHELHRQLGVTLKTAWFMSHRIRYAMGQEPLRSKLVGIVEADETYIGGRRRGTRRGRPSRDSHKVAVMTLVSRDGEARSQVVDRVTGDRLGKVLAEHMEPEAVLMTDEYSAYKKPGQQFAAHHTVNHAQGEYGRGTVTTNTVEGYFSQLKRSIDGTHHHVSRRHLPKYLGEFDYRYSTRKMSDGDRMVETIKRAEGKRLRYSDPSESAVA